MQRLLAIVVAVVTLAVATSAAARPRHHHRARPVRKVRIVSDPPGATVYVGSKKHQRGHTPLDLSLPVGESTIILELDGYEPHVESVSVKNTRGRAARRRQTFNFALDASVGTIRLHGLPDGATVKVDGTEASTMDDKVEVQPGAHELVVSAPGEDGVFDQWVEVKAGEEKAVAIKFGAPPVKITHHAKKDVHRGKRPWYGTVGVGYELGWRRFRYDAPQTSNAVPFDGNGIGLVNVWGEVHPWRASAGAKPVWPLSITFGFGLGLPVTATAMSGATADVFWRTSAVGLRWRWNIAHAFGLDFDAGWARTLYTFRNAMGGLVDSVPDVDYETLRAGIRGVVKAGSARVYAGIENRVVASGGELGNRFRGASAQGLGGRAGLFIPIAKGRVVFRVEGNLERFGWSFSPMTGDPYIADGATDMLYGVTFGVGAAY
jgi:PEGA domain